MGKSLSSEGEKIGELPARILVAFLGRRWVRHADPLGCRLSCLSASILQAWGREGLCVLPSGFSAEGALLYWCRKGSSSLPGPFHSASLVLSVWFCPPALIFNAICFCNVFYLACLSRIAAQDRNQVSFWRCHQVAPD